MHRRTPKFPTDTVSQQAGGAVRDLEASLRQAGAERMLRSEDAELRNLLVWIDRRRTARRLGLAGGPQPPRSAQTPASIPKERGTASSPGISAPPGTLVSTEEVAPQVRILRATRPTGFSFLAGQHTKLGVPGGTMHSYTIASAPHEPELEFCIELVPGGKLTPQLFALSPGGLLSLGGAAKGDFVLRQAATTHLMVATVTGIAPFRSMILDSLKRGESDRFMVLHGASYADELVYRSLFEQLQADPDADVVYHATVSRPTEARNRNWAGHTGRVDALARRIVPELTMQDPGVQVYACGNSGMIENMRSLCKELGLPLATEAFD